MTVRVSGCAAEHLDHVELLGPDQEADHQS